MTTKERFSQYKKLRDSGKTSNKAYEEVTPEIYEKSEETATGTAMNSQKLIDKLNSDIETMNIKSATRQSIANQKIAQQSYIRQQKAVDSALKNPNSATNKMRKIAYDTREFDSSVRTNQSQIAYLQSELKNHLWRNSKEDGIKVRELRDEINKMKADPASYVDIAGSRDENTVESNLKKIAEATVANTAKEHIFSNDDYTSSLNNAYGTWNAYRYNNYLTDEEKAQYDAQQAEYNAEKEKFQSKGKLGQAADIIGRGVTYGLSSAGSSFWQTLGKISDLSDKNSKFINDNIPSNNTMMDIYYQDMEKNGSVGSRIANKFRDISEEQAAKMQRLSSYTDNEDLYGLIGNTAMAVGSSIPYAALAIVSGGSGAGLVAERASGIQAVNSTYGITMSSAQANVLGKVMNSAAKVGKMGADTVTSMLSNPSFYMSYASTAGPAYFDALEAGATESEAAIASFLTAAINSGIEIGSGIETVSKNPRTFLNFLRSASEEGAEEVKQGIVEQIVAKATYGSKVPWISATNENAVFSLPRAAQEYTVGALAGGFGVGTTMLGQAAMDRAATVYGNRLDANIKSLSDVETALREQGLTPEATSDALGIFQKIYSGTKLNEADVTEIKSNPEILNVFQQVTENSVSEDADVKAFRQAAKDSKRFTMPNGETVAASDTETVAQTMNPTQSEEAQETGVFPAKNARVTVNTGENLSLGSDPILEVKDGVVQLQDDEGHVVDMDDVTFHNERAEQLFQTVKDFTTNEAKAFLFSDDGKTIVKSYARAFSFFHDQAMYGDTIEQAHAKAGVMNQYISQEAALAAYDAGKNDLNDGYTLDSNGYVVSPSSGDAQNVEREETSPAVVAAQINSVEQTSPSPAQVTETVSADSVTKENTVAEATETEATETEATETETAKNATTKETTEEKETQKPATEQKTESKEAAPQKKKRREHLKAGMDRPGLHDDYTTTAYDKLGTRRQMRLINQKPVLNALGKRYGVSIIITDSITREDGKSANASYDPQTRQITIALDAQEQAYLYFAGHELAHDLKNVDEQAWGDLFVMISDQLIDSGYDLATELQALVDEEGYTLEEAQEEIFANNVSMLFDEENLMRIAEEDANLGNLLRNFFARFRDTLQQISAKLQNVLGYSGVQHLKENTAFAEKAFKVLDEALVKNRTSTTAGETKYSIQKEKYSIKGVVSKGADPFNGKSPAQVAKELEYWKKQCTLTKGVVPSRESVSTIAKEMKGKYNLAMSVKALTDMLTQLYETSANAEEADAESLNSLFYDVASTIAENSRERIVDLSLGDPKEIKNYFRTTTLYVTEALTQDAGFGSVAEMRRKNMGRMKIVSTSPLTKVNVDGVYREFSNNFAGLLPSDLLAEGDQLRAITDFVDTIYSDKRTVYQNVDDIAGISAELKDAQLRIHPEKTFADKSKEGMETLRRYYDGVIRASKEKSEKKLTKVRERFQKALDAERNRVESVKKRLYEMERLHNERVELMQTRHKEEILSERERATRINDLDNQRMQNMDTKFQQILQAERERYVSARQKELERIEKIERRTKIDELGRQLNTLRAWAEHPTRTHFVPEPMRMMILNFVLSEDFSRTHNGKPVNSINVYRSTLKEVIDVLSKVVARYNGDIGEYYRQQLGGRFEYAQINVDQSVIDLLNQAVARLNATEGKTIEALDKECLNALLQSTTMIRHILTHVNQTWSTSLHKNAAAIAQQSITELSTQKRLNSSKRIVHYIGLDQLDFRSLIHRLGPEGESVFRTLSDGEIEYFRKMSQVSDYTQTQMDRLKISQRQYRNWVTVRNKVKFGGNDVEMTQAELAEFYLLTKREQARRHLLWEPTNGYKGYGFQMHIGSKDIKVNKITEAEVKQAESLLDPKLRELAEMMQQFISVEAGKWRDNTNLLLYGYKMNSDPNYWRIKTKTGIINIGDDAQMNPYYILANQSATKETDPKADSPLWIGNVFESYTEQANAAAKYYAYTPAIKDIQTFMDYREYGDDGNMKTMDGILTDVFGISGEGRKGENVHGQSRFSRLVEGYIRTLSSGEQARQTGIEEKYSKIVSRFKKGAVALNIRVIIQQPVAMIRAAAEMNAQEIPYIANIFNPSALIHFQRDQKEMRSVCPIAWWKSEGHFETGTGKSLSDIVTGRYTTEFEAFQQASMKPAGFADDWAWVQLFRAVRHEVLRSGLQKGTAEYNAAVNERFTEIIDKTQVVDTTLHRSSNMLSPNILAKTLTAFMAEPTRIQNMVMNAAYDVTQAKGKKAVQAAVVGLVGTLTSVLFSQVVNDALKSVWDAFTRKGRDKDYGEDDEYPFEPKEYTFFQSWYTAFLRNLFDDMLPSSYLPLIRDFAGAVSYYPEYKGGKLEHSFNLDFTFEDSVLNNALSWAGDILEIYERHRKGSSKKSDYRLYRDLLKDLLGALGIGSGLVTAVDAFANSLSKDGLSLVSGTGTIRAAYKTMYDAMKSGDTNTAADMMNALHDNQYGLGGKSREDIKKNIAYLMIDDPEIGKKIAKAYDLKASGKLTEYSAIIDGLTQRGFDGDIAKFAVEFYELKAENPDYNYLDQELDVWEYGYEDLDAALKAGDTNGAMTAMQSIVAARDESSSEAYAVKRVQSHIADYMAGTSDEDAEADKRIIELYTLRVEGKLTDFEAAVEKYSSDLLTKELLVTSVNYYEAGLNKKEKEASEELTPTVYDNEHILPAFLNADGDSIALAKEYMLSETANKNPKYSSETVSSKVNDRAATITQNTYIEKYLAGDTTAVSNIEKMLTDYFGYTVKDFNGWRASANNNAIKDSIIKITTNPETAEKEYEDVYDLNAAQTAINRKISEIVSAETTKKQQQQAYTSACSSCRKAITGTFKPVFLMYLQNGDTEKAEKLASFLCSLELGKSGYSQNELYSSRTGWIKDLKEEE